MLVDRLTLQKIDDIGRNIMNDMSIKEQMMQLTKQCILSNDDKAMLECLQIYKSSFGYDDFYITSLSSLRITPEPLVSLIYIKQPDEDEQACCDNINRYNNYQNLEITVLSADNLLKIFIIVLPVCQVNISAFATVTTNMTATVFGLCFYYLARMILLMESFAVEILLRQIIQSLHILSEFTGKYLMNIFLVEISY